MIRIRHATLRLALPAAVLLLGGLAVGAWGLKVSRADGNADVDRAMVRQVTVFAIVATPGGKSVDTNLSSIQPQLNRLLPRHGFKLLDVQSAPIVAGESVDSKLGHGYTAQVSMVRPIDENGKVQLRCEILLDGTLQFAASVRTPPNQLFFCERPFLTDGSKLLLGVGAR